MKERCNGKTGHAVNDKNTLFVISKFLMLIFNKYTLLYICFYIIFYYICNVTLKTDAYGK